MKDMYMLAEFEVFD